jgi:hypothetical protein
MKVLLLLLFLVLSLSGAKAFSCQGIEVDSCEAVLSPSAERCRFRYEILYEMHANSNQGPTTFRGKQCGFSGIRCVRMGGLCVKHEF